MREVNFLPAWYPRVVRQKRLLTAQVWATGVLVTAALAVLLHVHLKTAAVRKELTASRATAEETVRAVRQLDEMLDLQRQLNAKQSIVSELGLPVELSRLLAEMGSCAPREVTFIEFEANTVEQAPQTIAERAMAAASGKAGPSRRLELKLRGVAPTETEVTTFWSRLIQKPFMSQVRLVNSTEKIEGEHVMREFEITFAIPLDAPPAQEGA